MYIENEAQANIVKEHKKRVEMTQVPTEKGVNKKGKSVAFVPRERETRASKKQRTEEAKKEVPRKTKMDGERAKER